MGVLSERQINIYMFGSQDVGKTVNVTAHYSNPILAKEGGSKISINFEKSSDILVLEKTKKGILKDDNRYVGTQRQQAYSAVLNYKDSNNVSHQSLASVNFIDVPGGIYDSLLKNRDYDIDQFNLDLSSNAYTYNVFLLLVNIYSFVSCENYPFSCGKIKGEKCKHFCSKTGKKNQTAFDCTYFNREFTQNFIYQALRLATKNNCRFQIVVNHCDDSSIFRNEKEKNGLMDEVKDTITTWLDEAPFDYDVSIRPNIYFIDSVSAIKKKDRWVRTARLPILDVLYSFLENQEMNFSLERQGKAGFFKNLNYAWHKFLFNSPVEMRDRCCNLIRQQLNLYGDGGVD